jgi:hypothetical protein
VACFAALLCALPAVVAALPVPDAAIGAAALRSRILASATVPYQGYAESTINLGLPALPDLGQVSTLLDGTTDQYAWYRSPDRWRADLLTTAGEDDTYQAPAGIYEWNYTLNLLTHIIGAQPVRLPRAADLLPPALARRLVAYASLAARYSRLPSRRIAGVDAAGLQIRPSGPLAADTTIGAVDVWADPASGLPVAVQIFARGSAQPVLQTGFIEVSEQRPALATVTPVLAPQVGAAVASLPDVFGILNSFGPLLPARLGRLDRIPTLNGLRSVGAYGTGFTRFAVIPLPGRVGVQALRAAGRFGAAVKLPDGTGVMIRTPLLTVVLARPRFGYPTFLLAGTVLPSVLRRAASGLLTAQAGIP